MEGSVERSGDRVRVSVHLDQVSPESQLWARHFDRSLRDTLTLQAEIARAVTDEIQVKLTPEERVRLGSVRPVNPEAQDVAHFLAFTESYVQNRPRGNRLQETVGVPTRNPFLA